MPDLPIPTRSVTAALVAASALFVAACGGAPGDSTDGTAAASGASDKDAPIAFSKCMRSHGVPGFPDPDGQGRIMIRAQPGDGLDPASPAFKRATEACKSLAPKRPSAAQQRKDLAKALEFARCMRAHGVPDFPDPQPDSGPQLHKRTEADAPEIGPDSPQFKSAMQACESLDPGGFTVGRSDGPRSAGS